MPQSLELDAADEVPAAAVGSRGSRREPNVITVNAAIRACETLQAGAQRGLLQRGDQRVREEQARAANSLLL